jgi:outer membrane protein OmpA-like peptidoglycan-associated protein/flagellar hook assembly protein FlgD
MKKRIIMLGVIAALTGISAFSYAETIHSGKFLSLYGNSAAAMGRGGTGVAGYGPDIFFMNPATSAELERVSASLSYGNILGQYKDAQPTLLVPTSYGTIGGTFRYLKMSGTTADFATGYSGMLGAGKDFTDRLAFGVTANVLYASQPGGGEMYWGGTIGALYHPKYKNEVGKGFGLYDPRFGISVNAGIPLGDESKYVNMNQASMGYSFSFFKNDLVSIGLYTDVSGFDGYKKVSAKFGTEAVFKERYVLRAGGSAPQKYEYGDFTAGAGFRMNEKSFSGEISYAIVHYDKMNFVHYVGVSAEFGELDRTPPATQVKSDQTYVSPNNDGAQDYALITLNVKDRSKIKGWQLQVLDQKGAVVKEYKAPDRDVIQSLTFKGFFQRLVSPKESAVVPDEIMWDGVDTFGAPVSDGKYIYSFWAWDERDNYAEKKTGEITVDRTPPAAQLKNDDVLFSPNGDGKKDEFVITQKIATAPEDEWEAGFYDEKGQPVKSYKWTGSGVPAQVKWNGKDDKGNDVPEGLYRYQIGAKDKAGNIEKQTVAEISLTRKFETADISVSREYFSFNKERSLTFRPFLSGKEGLTAWQIIIENESGKAIRVIKGEGTLPEKVEWDVSDNDKKPLSDGKYSYWVKGSYRSGNEPASFKKQFIVDSTPPTAEVDFTPDLFSPDGDNENDVLTIQPEAADKFGIADWNIVIKNPTNVLFKQYNGKGNVPKEIKWDGISDKGELVESASDYTMILTVTDKAGNSVQSKPAVIPVDVLVIVTERGLKIRISNIQFGYDSDKILPQGTKILNRVATIFDKYARYKVLIEGHTDDTGDEGYNLKLSERRAQSVKDYLISKGVDKDRLKVRGMGESSPFVPNKDDESRRKNRRVEFLLEKVDKQ